MELSTKSYGGHGPHLIFLHGWGQNKESWEPLAKFFQKDYRVHLLDLPGFGDTPRPENTWGTSDYAEKVASYIKDNEIKDAILLGHSFGGKVILDLALNNPGLIDRAILIAAAGMCPQRSWWRHCYLFFLMLYRKSLQYFDKVFHRDLYRKYFIPRFASADYQKNKGIRDILVKVLSENYDDRVADIKHPIQLIWGNLDRETPISMGYKLKVLLPNSRFLLLSGKDHFPFKGVGSHLCAYHIKKFLEDRG